MEERFNQKALKMILPSCANPSRKNVPEVESFRMAPIILLSVGRLIKEKKGNETLYILVSGAHSRILVG
jgi:hypothetical protein